jgi:hypothetical protein
VKKTYRVTSFGWFLAFAVLWQVGEDVFACETSSYLWWMQVVFLLFFGSGFFLAIIQELKVILK